MVQTFGEARKHLVHLQSLLEDHDIASNLAEPVSLLISLLATYFRCDDFVDPTNQQISFTYLRHVLDEPPLVGTLESRSIEFISYRRAHSGAN